MTVADGSQVRLADVSEVTPGTTPANPTFQIMRYSPPLDLRFRKQTDITDEVRPDRNVSGIVDIGRVVEGNISSRFSFTTYDTWLSRLLCAAWSTDALVNGSTHLTATLETFFEQGATDSFVRYQGCRWNTLELTLEARQPVKAQWGIMGIRMPTPTAAILTGATYTAATTTEEFNAGLNVANLAFSGVTSSPKMKSLKLRITNNIYANDIVGSYDTYSHGLGRLEVSGSAETYFENLDMLTAVIEHDTLGLSFDLVDAAGNTLTFEVPHIKALDGGPTGPGNGRATMLDVPFQGFHDSGIGGTIKITRDAA